MTRRFDRTNVVPIATTAPESFEPQVVLSAHRPNAAADNKTAHNAQVWSGEISVCMKGKG